MSPHTVAGRARPSTPAPRAPSSLDVVGRPTQRGLAHRAEQLDRDRDRLLNLLEAEQLRPFIAPAAPDLRRARQLARLLEAGQ